MKSERYIVIQGRRIIYDGSDVTVAEENASLTKPPIPVMFTIYGDGDGYSIIQTNYVSKEYMGSIGMPRNVLEAILKDPVK